MTAVYQTKQPLIEVIPSLNDKKKQKKKQLRSKQTDRVGRKTSKW